MSRIANGLLLSSLAVMLGACASYSGIHGEERETSPRSLAFQQPEADGVFVRGDWPRADWWVQFGDSKLDALVAQSLASNPTLHVALARVRRAQSLADVSRSALYPTLDLNASAGRQRLSENDIDYPPSYAGRWVNSGRVTLDFKYEFDFWGKQRDTLNAAIGEARASEAEAAAVRLMLATAVAQTYFQLQADIATVEVTRHTLAEREGLRELNRELARRGLDTSIPVRQADQQVASSRVELSAALAAVELDRHQLAALAGLGPDAALDVQPELHAYEQAVALPENLPVDLLARRPDLAAQRLRAEAAASRIGAAKADFYPNIDLIAFVGLDAAAFHGLSLFTAGSRVGGFGPALHLPIFDAGRLRAELGARYGEYDVAVATYNETLLAALRDVADRLVNLRATRQQLADQAEALAAAEDALQLTLDRYRAGLTNYLDVLVNEERVLAERLNNVRLQGRSLAFAVDTMRALGGGYRVDPPIAQSMSQPVSQPMPEPATERN